MTPSAEQFFTLWIDTCVGRQAILFKDWKNRFAFTSHVLQEPNSIIESIADSLGLKSYGEYYSTDAILFRGEDLVPLAPEGQTWLRRIRIAFEHEHDFNSGLFQETSHLLITDCDLRVLVSYPNSQDELNAELAYLHTIVSGSDRAQGISDSDSLLFIIGWQDEEKETIDWHGYVFKESGWHRIRTQPPAVLPSSPLEVATVDLPSTQSASVRFCFREPIPEIAEAACYLNEAISAHLDGLRDLAEKLIRQADIPAIREGTESLWGANSPYVQPRTDLNTRLSLSKEERIKARMPTRDEKRLLHERDGYHCRFCGIPVIRTEVRNRIKVAYPDALLWGRRNVDQHAAFQAMWAQYDHLLPHCKGGDNDLLNIVITCAPCNFGRMDYTLEEVGLIDPRTREIIRSEWDGLERFR